MMLQSASYKEACALQSAKTGILLEFNIFYFFL